MAVTITQDATIGAGGSNPVFAHGGGGVLELGVYHVAFDASYPTGGEDISSIWTDFKSVVAVFATQNDATVADVNLPVVDMTNKKLILVKTLSAGANAEVANAADMSGVADMQLLVVGVKK